MTPPSAWRIDGRDWPNREASRFIMAGGVRWHVQVSGNGPVVLLLHGTGAATHSWRDLAPRLAERFTVVVPDLPGHGFTSALGAPTLPAMARAVGDLLAALEVTPALIVAHSAGAAVALQLGGRAPVISFNGALLPFPGPAARLFPALAKLLFVNPVVPAIAALQARAPGVVERFLIRATGSHIDARGTELYTRLFRHREHVAAALAMMANWDLATFAAGLPHVTAPLLLIDADRDAAVPPSVAREVAGLVPGAMTLTMPDLGHLSHEEDPAAAVRIILDAAAAWGI